MLLYDRVNLRNGCIGNTRVMETAINVKITERRTSHDGTGQIKRTSRTNQANEKCRLVRSVRSPICDCQLN